MKTYMFAVWFAWMYKYGVDMIRFYSKEEYAFAQADFIVSSGIPEMGVIRRFRNMTKIHSYLIFVAVKIGKKN